MGKRRNREIMVDFDRDDVNEGVVLRFFDNGQGLDVASIATRMLEFASPASDRAEILRGEHTDRKKRDLIYEGIFEERVTTKAGGSGYGLYLARKMAEYHGGSVSFIEPQDRRWSAGFRIDFSTDLRKVIEKNNKLILRVMRDERAEAEKKIMNAMISANKQIEIVYPSDI
jgi:hypothetical protein